MSYHLKELAPLVEQSERGKYRLSEGGKAGMELFQGVRGSGISQVSPFAMRLRSG